ncbi:MAG: VCBS repeat-containing protein [Clostridiaceae bacterium]
MKFKAILLHITTLWYFLILLLSIFIITFCLISQKNSRDTLPVASSAELKNGIQKDLNADGKTDIIFVTSNEGKYCISADINNRNYILSPDASIATLGREYPYWGLRLYVKDISRDGIPEIFIQSSQENIPVFHIFSWNGVEFKDYYCSNNNVAGILNSDNNKTPKVYSGKVVNGIFSFESYMLLGNSFKNKSFDDVNVPGKQAVIELIDAIESPETPGNLPDFFDSSSDKVNSSLLWKLEKNIYRYTFQDAFFIDDKWNKNGDIYSIKWQINFKRRNIQTSKDDSFIVNAKVVLINNGYKVYSVSLY